MNRPTVQSTSDGVVLTVQVQPKASRTECVGIHGNAIKVRVAAPPVDGAANDELLRFLARALGVPPACLLIQSGATGRHKRVSVKGVSVDRVHARLHLGSSKP